MSRRLVTGCEGTLQDKGVKYSVRTSGAMCLALLVKDWRRYCHPDHHRRRFCFGGSFACVSPRRNKVGVTWT